MKKKKIIYSIIGVFLVFLFVTDGIFKNKVNANTNSNSNSNSYEPVATGDIIYVTEMELKGK